MQERLPVPLGQPAAAQVHLRTVDFLRVQPRGEHDAAGVPLVVDHDEPGPRRRGEVGEVLGHDVVEPVGGVEIGQGRGEAIVLADVGGVPVDDAEPLLVGVGLEVSGGELDLVLHGVAGLGDGPEVALPPAPRRVVGGEHFGLAAEHVVEGELAEAFREHGTD